MKKNLLFIVIVSMLILTQISPFAEEPATGSVPIEHLDITKDFTYQPEGTTNLAIGKTAETSSNYNNATGEWHKSAINDGIIGYAKKPYAWMTNPNNPEDAKEDVPCYITIDLEQVFELSRIVLWPRQYKKLETDPVNGYPVDFTLEVSIDNENWTVVATRKDQYPTQIDYSAKIFDFDKISGRYVRMHCTKRTKPTNAFVVQLAEMAIYGSEPAATATPEPTEPSENTTSNSPRITAKPIPVKTVETENIHKGTSPLLIGGIIAAIVIVVVIIILITVKKKK